MSLRWPTSLAVNPADQCLYVLDTDAVLQLSADRRRLRLLVAAASTPCLRGPLHAGRRAGARPALMSGSWRPTDVAVTPSGRDLVVAERHALRVVQLATGAVTRYDCAPCNDLTVSAVAVRHDDVIVVAVADNVYTLTSRLPAPHHVTRNYDVIDPTAPLRYTFNRSVFIM